MDENLKIWELLFKSRSWGKYPPIALVRFIERNFGKKQNKSQIKILEIGPGPGANLWYLAREGYSVLGIDGSKTACELALKRLKEENLSSCLGGIVHGDYIDKIDSFDDGFFDAVIDVESLCCNSFQKTSAVIKKSFSKLKSGGKFFSIAFDKETWGFAADEIDYHGVYPSEGPLSGEGFNRFTTREDIHILYGFCGSKILNIEKQTLELRDEKKIVEWLIESEKDNGS